MQASSPDSRARRWRTRLAGLAAALVIPWSAAHAEPPILVVTATANPFTGYYAEILRAEGLNAFAQADLSTVNANVLANYDVVVLGETPLSAAQVTLFENWVGSGGNLVAMRPDKQLAPLLGLTDAAATLSDGYLLVDTSAAPGKGIVGETIQFHAAADRYTSNGATTVATLYSSATVPTSNPAVTWRAVGANGGHAAAFTYDLARSVIYTRQGNPAWAGVETDGSDPIRTNDLFFPNYVNLAKVAIPQADEQQRLLANLVTRMNLAKKPLPRLWYLPSGHKAAIIHALDDHGSASASIGTFDELRENSPAGCSVDDWTCLRGTSWAFANFGLTAQQATDAIAQGFELGVHVQNNCSNFESLAQLSATYDAQLNDLAEKWEETPVALPVQKTHRYHCIVWSDWATQAKAARAHGIRFSLDYYYWPGTWVAGRSGLFTGSGIPMRFADSDGSTLDIYQGVSNLVNETNTLSYPQATATLLARALGPEGYYGMFGTHDDNSVPAYLDSLIGAAIARNVPIITAQQALTWLDGRNASSFSNLAWNGTTLGFHIAVDADARNLRAMLPSYSATNALASITKGGVAVPFTTQTIKGVSYAFFAASTGDYVANYDAAPSVPANGSTLWTSATTPANPSWNDSNAVELGVKFTSERRGRITGVRFYKGAGNSGTHVGNLWDASGALLASATFTDETPAGWQQVNFATPVDIAANTLYVASYHAPNGHYAADPTYFGTSGVDNPPLHAPAVTNGLYVYGASAFPTQTYNSSNYWVEPVFADIPPSTLFAETEVPANVAANDTDAVELGVKFTADVPGRITAIRFFKGVPNTGTHTATLWDAAGNAIANATFASETASGWQTVQLATPVAITANTVYVASYHAPNGRYAASPNAFANAHDNGPLHAPASANVTGGNGVYRYGPTAFPNSTFNANNYWVDVIFERD